MRHYIVFTVKATKEDYKIVPGYKDLGFSLPRDKCLAHPSSKLTSHTLPQQRLHHGLFQTQLRKLRL